MDDSNASDRSWRRVKAARKDVILELGNNGMAALGAPASCRVFIGDGDMGFKRRATAAEELLNSEGGYFRTFSEEEQHTIGVLGRLRMDRHHNKKTDQSVSSRQGSRSDRARKHHENQCIGIAGELAVARWLRGPQYEHDYLLYHLRTDLTRGDGGSDLQIADTRRVDVKTTRRKHGDLLVTRKAWAALLKKPSKRPDVYVSCRWHQPDSVAPVGWCTFESFRDHHQVKDLGYGPTCFYDADAMLTFETPLPDPGERW